MSENTETEAPVSTYPQADNALSQSAIYLDAKGRRKAAIVVGTHESVADDTSIPRPQSGFAHLIVFTPVGQPSPRVDVPHRDFALDNTTSFDPTQNVWFLA